MIAGELESALYDSYDYFQFGKNQNTKVPSTGSTRPSLGQRLGKVGKKIDEAGGMEGIGRTLDNVRTFLKPGDPASAPPADYAFGVKKPDPSTTSDTSGTDKNNPPKKKDNNLFMIGALVIGGIIVLGGAIWWVNRDHGQQTELATPDIKS